MQPVFRFAPSPNGELHLGHAFSALLDYELCRRAGGRFLVRIEDIDRTRCRPGIRGRRFSAISPGWGSTGRSRCGGSRSTSPTMRRRSENSSAMGLAYPAFLSRGEIAAMTTAPDWPRDPDGAPLYPGARPRPRSRREAERRIAAGAPYALRLRTAEAAARAGPLSWREAGAGPGGETGTVAADPAVWGDFILARKETPTSYHLSVVVDDAAAGRDPCRPRPRSLSCDRGACAPPAAPRAALAGLSPPRSDHRRVRAEARQVGPRHRLRSLREAGDGGDIRRMVGIDAALAAIAWGLRRRWPSRSGTWVTVAALRADRHSTPSRYSRLYACRPFAAAERGGGAIGEQLPSSANARGSPDSGQGVFLMPRTPSGSPVAAPTFTALPGPFPGSTSGAQAPLRAS